MFVLPSFRLRHVRRARIHCLPVQQKISCPSYLVVVFVPLRNREIEREVIREIIYAKENDREAEAKHMFI